MLSHLQSGRRPRDFPIQDYTRHDADRARQILTQLRGDEADLEYLRRLLLDLRARMRDAFARTEQPLVPRSNDAYFEDTLRALADLEGGDAKVATDYLHWAATKTDAAVFLTGDNHLYDGLRGLSREILSQKFGARSSNFDFRHLRNYPLQHPP